MARTYEEYHAVGFILSFGFPIVVLAILFYLMYRHSKKFYQMIKSMFSIKHHEATAPDGIESIDLYGVLIHLPTTACGFLPRFALVLMATATLTSAFIFFFSGIILVNEYLPPNSKCPSDGDMDCYTITNGTYFHCNSSDTRIDESLGDVICYRWMKENLDTRDVLNQIGLCTGLIQALRWFITFFLRVLLDLLQRNKQRICKNAVKISSRRRRLVKMVFKHLVVIVISLCPCMIFIVLSAGNISRTGTTMIFLITLFLVSVSGILLFITYEREKFKQDNKAYNKLNTIAGSVPQEDIPNKRTDVIITKIAPIIN